MKPSAFTNILEQHGIDFFSGVPDSLLANLCAYISNNKPAEKHVIAVNEGASMAIAAGFHLATGRMACVYMQNSGQGNAVNPLCSLLDKDVYSIPTLMVIGWRGEPGTKDEPQHVKQGKVTVELNETLGVPTYIVGEAGESQDIHAIEELINLAKEKSCPVAVIIPKGFFEKEGISTYTTEHQLVREDVIERIISTFESAAFVSTTGKISRELHDLREKKMQTHEKDFLTVGSMGHASSIALGIAMAAPERSVLCVDGDGAALMHMGSLAVNACRGTKNYKHIVLNNEAHESVGGQPTVAGKISLTEIAGSCGYHTQPAVRSEKDLVASLEALRNVQGPAFLEIFVALGSRKELGRPRQSPVENKIAFMNYIHN